MRSLSWGCLQLCFKIFRRHRYYYCSGHTTLELCAFEAEVVNGDVFCHCPSALNGRRTARTCQSSNFIEVETQTSVLSMRQTPDSLEHIGANNASCMVYRTKMGLQDQLHWAGLARSPVECTTARCTYTMGAERRLVADDFIRVWRRNVVYNSIVSSHSS